jgi:cytochrome bd ubiquinol oxidase subunit II
MTLPDALAGTLLLSLVVYALLGGADFGGGVWDLFARGPRAQAQRETIAHAIGPIWEANHIWMIVAVVLLFTAFPPAFALIMTWLHVPIALLLIGIVLRGSSFVFRKADPAGEGATSGWQKVFAASSLLTPVMLGVVLGTISTPALIEPDGFFRPWMTPFPWAVGLFTLALFAFLAAVYLTLETDDDEIVDDFRRRALAATGAVLAAGTSVGLLATRDAPDVADHLLGTGHGVATLSAGTACILGAGAALLARRLLTARILAVTSVVTIMGGWALGLHPWLVAGALTIEEAAAPPVTLRLVGWILALGSLVLLPAYAYLYRTFKGGMLSRPYTRSTTRATSTLPSADES